MFHGECTGIVTAAAATIISTRKPVRQALSQSQMRQQWQQQQRHQLPTVAHMMLQGQRLCSHGKQRSRSSRSSSSRCQQSHACLCQAYLKVFQASAAAVMEACASRSTLRQLKDYIQDEQMPAAAAPAAAAAGSATCGIHEDARDMSN